MDRTDDLGRTEEMKKMQGEIDEGRLREQVLTGELEQVCAKLGRRDMALSAAGIAVALLALALFGLTVRGCHVEGEELAGYLVRQCAICEARAKTECRR